MDYIGSTLPEGLPYPNQIKEYAQKNHHAFFKEPVGERSTPNLRRVGEDQMDKLVKVHAPAFGSLSPIYGDQVGRGPLRTFFRDNRGTIDHGLGRTDEDTYECAKFNVLRHPRPADSNNPDCTGGEGQVTGLNQAFLNLVNYPNIPGAVMSAPLLPRHDPVVEPTDLKDGHFQTPKAQQPSAFTRVFEMTELCEKLLLEVGHRWGDLSNLSRTCQCVLYAVNKISTRVDLTKSDFLNLDYTDEETAASEAIAIDNGQKTDGMPRSAPAHVVMISNVRGKFFEPEGGEDEPNEFGYPARSKGYYEQVSPARRLTDTYKLLKSVYIRGSQMKILHFHGMPYLDVAVLRRCLRHLPNLEVLGIHNCELLHFGTTIDVLKQVITHNNEPGVKHLRSDFSPYYYTGPDRRSKWYTGEYGVIPSDQGTVETPRAMAAILSTAIPLALDNGIDWFTPGTGMRQFLERIPFELGTVRYILEAIYNIYNFEKGVTKPKYDLGKESQLPSYLREALHDAMRQTLYSDLVLAVHGKSMASRALCNTMSLGTHFYLMKCVYCKTHLPSFFFTKESARRHVDQIECCGCQLHTQLAFHIDNFFQQKQDALFLLFKSPRLPYTSTEAYLYGSRVATEDEINDPSFDFWRLAKNSQGSFEASLKQGPDDSQDALVLDGRPGRNHPDEFKKISLWKESMLEAQGLAEEHIDKAATKIDEEIAKCCRSIRILDDSHVAGLPNYSAVKENRDVADKFVRYADQQRALLGVGQMSGVHGTKVAASWDNRVEKYRQLINEQVGLLWNRGPYNTVCDDKPSGFF
ncbi:hypothetical protein GGR53DRAFT_527149 [Hypoxylon sp. FL1150]|nr:hypothetical protein GGR53DRAFT_527149 [Hypoxylon sp. FL1150]